MLILCPTLNALLAASDQRDIKLFQQKIDAHHLGMTLTIQCISFIRKAALCSVFTQLVIHHQPTTTAVNTEVFNQNKMKN